MTPRALPTLWTVRTPTGAISCRREGETFIPTSAPWIRERASLLRLFVGNDFRARYRAQALGVLWSLLQPLVMMAILSLVFTRAFRSTEPNFPVFLLLGLLVWQWVSSSLNAATIAFVANAELVKRTVFPRVLLPMSSVLSYGINAAIESIALVALIPFFHGAFHPSFALVLVPVVLLVLVTLLSGAALAIAALNVIYRDVAYLVSTGLSIVYWLTPIVYPPTLLPETWRELFSWNPLYGVVTMLRAIVMHAEWPTLSAWIHLLVPTVFVLVLGTALFNRHEREMLDHV
ncbi:MAG: ABC transporter permease [Polyangia bacterium]